MRSALILALVGLSSLPVAVACSSDSPGEGSNSGPDAGGTAGTGGSSGAGEGSGAGPAPLGFVVIPKRYETTAAAWSEVFTQIRKTDASLFAMGYATWSETEPTPGTYDWSAFANLPTFESNEQAVWDVAVPVGFSGERDGPSDLIAVNMDSTKMRDRYFAYLESALANIPAKANRITMHTEGVLEYFRDRPDEQDQFCDLLEAAIDHLHTSRAGLRVGAYWRYENTDADLMACINRKTDYFALALILNPPDDKPTDVGTILNKYITAAAPKPVAVVEAGFPSDVEASSSEQDQTAFVRALFAAVRDNEDALEFVAYYEVFDENRASLQVVADQIYGPGPNPDKTALVAWLSSLGLQTEDDREKEAWPAFLEEAAKY